MSWIAPPRLGPGDTIAAVAPASPFERDAFLSGVKFLESLGYRVIYRPNIFVRRAYLAGDDTRRAEELAWALEQAGVRALWAVRGGFGVMRLFPLLDWDAMRDNPKIWLGFSDISALLCALFTRCGLFSVHAPQLSTLPRASTKARAHLLRLVTRPEAGYDLFDLPEAFRHPGQAEGRLLPMNLAMLCSLLATPWLPDLSGVILAIEDVNEPPYRIDRMLTQLSLCGALDRIAGMLTGHFTTGDGENGDTQPDVVRKRLVALARQHGFPLLGDVPFGHIDDNYALPVGVRVRLDADSGRLTLLEAPVS